MPAPLTGEQLLTTPDAPAAHGQAPVMVDRWKPPAALFQAAPLALVLLLFLLLPIALIVVVSFFDYDSVQIIPAFQFTNYVDVLGSAVTWRTYVNTFRYTIIVWAI